MSLKYSTIQSFSFAFSGLKLAIKNEPNFKIHTIIGLIAIILGFVLNLSFLELALLALTIGFVLILELINTTLEAVVNLISPEIKQQAKVAKDVAAAAVLVSAILSIVVGLFLFLPKIVNFL